MMKINTKTLVSAIVLILVISALIVSSIIKKKEEANTLPGLVFKKDTCMLASENKKTKAYFKILGSTKSKAVKKENQDVNVYVVGIFVTDLANNILTKSQTTATEKTLTGLQNRTIECPSFMK